MDDARFAELTALLQRGIDFEERRAAIRQRPGRPVVAPEPRNEMEHLEADGLYFAARELRQAELAAEHRARRHRADREVAEREALHGKYRDWYGLDEADRMMSS